MKSLVLTSAPTKSIISVRVVTPGVIATDERQPTAKIFSKGLEKLQEMKRFKITRIHDSRLPHHKIYVLPKAAEVPARKMIDIIKKFNPAGVIFGTYESDRKGSPIV